MARTSDNPINKYLTEDNKIDIVKALVDLDYRITRQQETLDYIMNVIKGMSEWAEQVEAKLKELEPKVKIYSPQGNQIN